MYTTNDGTKIISYPLRPVGFKPSRTNKDVTMSDIQDWIKKEKPSTIQCLPNFALWTSTGTVVSAILSFIGIKKENNYLKWGGGILGILGIGISAFGVSFANLLKESNKNNVSANTEILQPNPNNKKDKLQNELIEISNANESKKDSMRLELLCNKYKDCEAELEELLNEIIKEKKLDKALINEANNCLSILGDIVCDKRAISELKPLLKDKSKDTDSRLRAASELGRVNILKDPEIIPTLANCVEDKSESPKIREAALYSLSRIALRMMRKGEDPKSIETLFINYINDINNNISIRLTSTTLLEEIGDLDTVETLRRILNKMGPNLNASNNDEFRLFTQIGITAGNIEERIVNK